MKKLILLLIFGINSLLGYSGYYAPYKAGTSQKVSQGYDGRTSHYGAGGAYAIDFSGSFDIYAPKDGIVDYVGKDSYKIPFCVNNPQYWHGSANYIRVKHDDGVYSYYFHLKTVNVKKGDKVTRGKTILGVSGNTGCSTATHLHFQLSKKASMSRANSLKISFEDIGIPSEGKYYTSKNYPEKSTNNESIVDGAGSLVSPNENIAGGNHDYALMNPHDSAKSTVVFQWLYDIDSCSHIDLFSYPNALDVTIQAKKWSGHSMKKAFNVTLNPYNKKNLEHNSNTLDLSNGISLEQAETNCNGDDIVGCNWTTLAVTSQRPLRRGEYIIAHCRDNSASIKRGNRQDITPTLVNLPSDYFWTGTGSLISKIGNRNFEEAGVGKDYAVTYNSKKSFTTFQWYASDVCSKVRVKGYKEGYSSINEVSIKKWNDNSWSSNKCGNSLPCTISAPILNKYYIIKVKGNAGAIKTGYLQTECVQ